MTAASEAGAASRSVIPASKDKHRLHRAGGQAECLAREQAYETRGRKNLGRRYPAAGTGGLVRDQAHTSRLSPLIPCKITPE